MDWKYKHSHQERVFPASRDVVKEAARTFMAESLGWQITDTPDGFTAQGHSFTHRAIAHLHFQTVAAGASLESWTSSESGTRVAIELLVERAGWRGYMLFDVGGYYNIQIRKWLDGIQWSLRQKLTGTRDESQNPLVLAEKKPAAYIFNGCLVFIVVMFAHTSSSLSFAPWLDCSLEIYICWVEEARWLFMEPWRAWCRR
jgi:hypothetical protein